MEAKKLGFGLMRLPLTDANDGASIDMEKTKEMVDTFIEKGFTYFDTAWMYCGFRSEDAAKECLVDRHPRDSYTLATKLHASFISNKEDRDKIFQQQLKKTGVRFIRIWTASTGWWKRRNRVLSDISVSPTMIMRNF